MTHSAPPLDAASPAPGRSLSLTRQGILALYWFGISFLWGSFNAIVLPFLLLPEHPGPGNPALVDAAQKNTALGVLESLGLLFAIVLQPAAGAWSDRLRTRWGRRRPLIAVGAFGGVLALGMAFGAQTFWILLGAYCLLQICMNVSQGGYQGLLPDVVPGEQRGEASGFLGVGTLAGQVAGVGSLLFIHGRVACLLIAAVVGITALLTVVCIDEPPLPVAVARPAAKRSVRSGLDGLRGYLAEFRRYPDFCWVVASRFAVYAGLACIQRFAANFLRDTYRSEDLFTIHLGGLTVPLRSAGTATPALFAVVIFFGLVATYPAVRLSDRIGRRRVLVGASLFGALGSGLFFAAPSITAVMLCAIPIGIAFGMITSVDWAYMADLAPRNRSGKFLGFSNVATAGSQAFAPALLGPVIDGVNGPSGVGGYHVLFAVSAAFFLLGGLILTRVRIQRIPEEAPIDAESGLAAAAV